MGAFANFQPLPIDFHLDDIARILMQRKQMQAQQQKDLLDERYRRDELQQRKTLAIENFDANYTSQGYIDIDEATFDPKQDRITGTGAPSEIVEKGKVLLKQQGLDIPPQLVRVGGKWKMLDPTIQAQRMAALESTRGAETRAQAGEKRAEREEGRKDILFPLEMEAKGYDLQAKAATLAKFLDDYRNAPDDRERKRALENLDADYTRARIRYTEEQTETTIAERGQLGVKIPAIGSYSNLLDTVNRLLHGGKSDSKDRAVYAALGALVKDPEAKKVLEDLAKGDADTLTPELRKTLEEIRDTTSRTILNTLGGTVAPPSPLPMTEEEADAAIIPIGPNQIFEVTQDPTEVYNKAAGLYQSRIQTAGEAATRKLWDSVWSRWNQLFRPAGTPPYRPKPPAVR